MARLAALQRLVALRVKAGVEDEPAPFFGALAELRREEPAPPAWAADAWPARAAAFLAWLKQHGAPLSDALELRHTRERGTGVYAVRPLKAGEALISVPAALWLSPNDAARAGLPALDPLFADPLLAASPAVRLALILVAGGGAWAPYAALLPPTIASPALFSAAAFARLRPSSAYAAAVRAQLTAARQYVHLTALLAQPAHAAAAALLRPLTFARYAWALATVQSRLNTLPDGSVGLVPLWDLCNHSPALPPSTHASLDQLAFAAPADVPAGAEVLMNYGPRTLAQLFLTYAFVPRPPPPGPLAVPLSFLLAAPPAAPRPPPAAVVELWPDGRAAAAADQVRALHGRSVRAWARDLLAAIEAAAAAAPGADAPDDERLACAMLEAERDILRAFVQHAPDA